MSQDIKPLKVPKKTSTDIAVDVFKNIIPRAGVAAALINTPFERRLASFWEDVAGRVNSIQDTLSELSVYKRALAGDEDAIDLLQSAGLDLSHLFVRTHDKEKREALKAAMCSIIARPSENEVAQAHQGFFLRCLRQFDGLHIKLLKAAEGGIVQFRESSTA